MFQGKNVIALEKQGFSMPEIGELGGMTTYEAIQDYMKAGLDKDKVLALFRASNVKQAKTAPKGQKGTDKQAEIQAEIPEMELPEGASIIDYNGVKCLVNEGTSRRANSLFVYLKGNVDTIHAKLETARLHMQAHIALIEKAQKAFKG